MKQETIKASVAQFHSFNGRLEPGQRLPETKQEAEDIGSDYYYPQTVCDKGHLAMFRTWDDKCTECLKIAAIERERTATRRRAIRIKKGMDAQRERRQLNDLTKEIWDE